MLNDVPFNSGHFSSLQHNDAKELVEVEGEPKLSVAYYYFDPNHKNNFSTRTPPPVPPQLAPLHLQQHQKFHLGLPNSPSMASISPPMMMAYGGGGLAGGGTESSSEDLNVY
ncbi:hypothetical protein NE237_022273 [Protea cynaroides]|uniref:Uncharacterized protein n=1 Tax=Protea cynaroides TaxID=273540 RepID=A0A9Q0HES2_9MAGN|nr:hypothetical protein NE237_022273 [Protea cynaroides]